MKKIWAADVTPLRSSGGGELGLRTGRDSRTGTESDRDLAEDGTSDRTAGARIQQSLNLQRVYVD